MYSDSRMCRDYPDSTQPEDVVSENEETIQFSDGTSIRKAAGPCEAMYYDAEGNEC